MPIKFGHTHPPSRVSELCWGVMSQAVILGVIVNLIIVLGGIVVVGTLSVPLFLGVKTQMHHCGVELHCFP